MDECLNTAAYDPSTSSENLMSFGPVTPEFRRRVCAGRVTRWALPRISSYIIHGTHYACSRPTDSLLTRTVNTFSRQHAVSYGTGQWAVTLGR